MGERERKTERKKERKEGKKRKKGRNRKGDGDRERQVGKVSSEMHAFGLHSFLLFRLPLKHVRVICAFDMVIGHPHILPAPFPNDFPYDNQRQ